MTATHADRQRTIDFNRAEQLGAIDRWVAPRRCGAVSGVVLKSVLRAIDSYCRGGWGFPSEATIAVAAGLASDRHVRRAIAALKSLSLVIVSRRRPADAGYGSRQTLNHYKIVFPNLTEEADQPDREADQPDREADQPDREGVSTGHPCPPNRRSAKDPPPTARTREAAAEVSATSEDKPDRTWAPLYARERCPTRAAVTWDQVAEGMRSTGLTHWQAATDECRNRGMTAAAAVDLAVTYFWNRSRLGGPGSIYHALRHGGVWPAEGIRPPAELLAEQDRLAEERRRKASQQAAQAAADDAWRGELAVLESAWGETFDGAGRAEQMQVIARSFPTDFERQYWAGKSDEPFWRYQVLKTTSQISGGCHDSEGTSGRCAAHVAGAGD